MTKINRVMFFDEVRRTLFANKLLQSQVQGLDLFLDENEQRSLTTRQFAYILATVHHETGFRWQPVEEIGKGSTKPYGKRIKHDGSRYTDTKNVFFGRGYIQATWYEVYQKLTLEAKKQGKDWDFIKNPELLLQSEPSAWSAFEGMQNGYYTGRKLSDYINPTRREYFNARKIINGKDCAGKILIYAELFESALTKATSES